MKTFYLFFVCFASSSLLFGQDTLFMNNEKVLANVKEITQDAVRFSYPEEDLINTVYKNSVQKIIFKNGRTQSFTEASSFKRINSVEDFENVTVTSVEGEIKGLYKIGDVSAKAKGATTFSNQERVKERAYRKFKIEGAMLGANIIYLSHQRTEGNRNGGYYGSSSSTETSLSGIAYSNILPDHNKFKSLINNKTLFTTSTRYKLWSSASDVIKEGYKKQFSIINIKNENGTTIIEAQLEGERKYTSFQLAYFDEDGFNIFYQSKSTAYNIRLSFN